jgi:plastocyanin
VKTRVAPSWGAQLKVTALAELVLLALVGIALADRETMAFAVVVAASSAWLLRRPRSRLAIAIRGLVFLDVAVFMLPATLSNIGSHEALGAVAAPLALSAVSVVGLVATAVVLVTSSGGARGSAMTVALPVVAGVFVMVGLVVSATGATAPTERRQGDVAIVAANVKFAPHDLSTGAGRVTVYMTNDDLFWHTFTSDDLHVSMSVPVKGHRSLTFNAPPGVYEFHCAIPGHATAGMTGKIVVGER